VYYYFPSKTDLVLAALREHPGAVDWTVGSFFASAEQGSGQDSAYWSALIACGLSTEQSVRAVFNGVIDEIVDSQVGKDPTLRLQAQLALGQVIGGWLLAGGVSPLAGEDARKWLIATAYQRLAVLAPGG
jgi:AcrR family transcriptional regulator